MGKYSRDSHRYDQKFTQQKLNLRADAKTTAPPKGSNAYNQYR